jgi:hypothetical protein
MKRREYLILSEITTWDFFGPVIWEKGLFIILWYGSTGLFLFALCFPFCVPTIRPWIPPTCQHATGDAHSLAMSLSLVLTNLFEGLHQVFYICCARTSNILISETQCYTSLNVLQVFFFSFRQWHYFCCVNCVYSLDWLYTVLTLHHLP